MAIIEANKKNFEGESPTSNYKKIYFDSPWYLLPLTAIDL